MIPGIFGPATFPIFLMLAIALGTGLHIALVRRAGLPVVRILSLYAAVALLLALGAGLFGALVDPDPAASGRITNRLRYPGALLALGVGMPLIARALGRGIPLRRWGDLMVPGAAFAIAFLRIDCFLAGCCLGRVSEVRWAVRFPAGSRPWYEQVAAGLIARDASASLPLHPLQLYFLGLSLLAGLLALWWLPRRAYDGQVVLLFLTFHEGGKFLLEFLRAPAVPEVQLVSFAVSASATLALGAIWLRGRLGTRLEAA
jgi:phosphatidylglycerol:prolipoprotein diacylglycerol transferase